MENRTPAGGKSTAPPTSGIEDFSIMELEDRFEFTAKCDTNCGCPPPPPPPPQT